MILALDPSLTCFGWVLATSDGKVARGGAIVTKPQAKRRHIFQADDDARRAAEIVNALALLVRNDGVTAIASEQPAGSKSAIAAKALGISLCAVVAVAEHAGLDVRWVRADEAKFALCKRAGASKDEMVEEAGRRGVTFNGPKPCREAVADAYGVLLASGLWRRLMVAAMPCVKG